MNLRQVYPVVDANVISTDLNLNALYPKLPGLRFNHVIAPTPSITSSEVTTNTDRLILRQIRSKSDLIITTGKTARNEHLRGSKFAPMLILTREDLVDGIPALDESSTNEVLVTVDKTITFQNTNARSIGRVNGLLAGWLENFLSSFGYESVVVETGLTTFKDLIQVTAFNEICLTVSGVSTQTSATEMAMEFLVANNVANVALIQILNDGSAWFFRFQVLGSK